jgi:hypothetical protein
MYDGNRIHSKILTLTIMTHQYQIQLLREIAERLKKKQENIIHLEWIYDRMKNVHNENENYDYMIKFREIIDDLKN